MTLGRLRDILNELCADADERELNGHVLIRNVNQHGAELTHLVQAVTTEGKPDGYTRWAICNIGWIEPKEDKTK